MTAQNDGALLGRVAISKAGRDKGARYAVIGVDKEGYMLLCDGRRRKAANPKRKKPMHLQFENARIEGIEAMLNTRAGTADAALRKALGRSADHHDDETD